MRGVIESFLEKGRKRRTKNEPYRGEEWGRELAKVSPLKNSVADINSKGSRGMVSRGGSGLINRRRCS